MAQVDAENSTATNVIPMRRRFLSTAAASAPAAQPLELASPPARAACDPVFALIGAHRTARAAHLAAITEQARLEEIGDPLAADVAEAPRHAERDTFSELINTVPMTFVSLQAWSSFLNETARCEGWMLQEEGPALVATLVEALENLAAAGAAVSIPVPLAGSPQKRVDYHLRELTKALQEQYPEAKLISRVRNWESWAGLTRPGDHIATIAAEPQSRFPRDPQSVMEAIELKMRTGGST
jgi:hypothetical protein